VRASWIDAGTVLADGVRGRAGIRACAGWGWMAT
jgi:hypothetical protein